jgi:hypothetical protein
VSYLVVLRLPPWYILPEGNHNYGQNITGKIDREITGWQRRQRWQKIIGATGQQNTQQVREARLEMARKLFAFKQSMQRCEIGPDQWDHYFPLFNG